MSSHESSPAPGRAATPRPMIRIHGREEVFGADLTTSILNVLLRNRFPIDTICGGRAICGRCLIRIRSGDAFLSPVGEREAVRLAALGAGPGMRLACQCHTRGEVEIDVINIRG
jgi:ferredoxin